MTNPSIDGDNMRAVLNALADENEFTGDEMYDLFDLISAGKTEEAISLLMGMMRRNRNVGKALTQLRRLEINAAKALLIDKGKDEP